MNRIRVQEETLTRVSSGGFCNLYSVYANFARRGNCALLESMSQCKYYGMEWYAQGTHGDAVRGEIAYFGQGHSQFIEMGIVTLRLHIHFFEYVSACSEYFGSDQRRLSS